MLNSYLKNPLYSFYYSQKILFSPFKNTPWKCQIQKYFVDISSLFFFKHHCTFDNDCYLVEQLFLLGCTLLKHDLMNEFLGHIGLSSNPMCGPSTSGKLLSCCLDVLLSNMSSAEHIIKHFHRCFLILTSNLSVLKKSRISQKSQKVSVRIVATFFSLQNFLLYPWVALVQIGLL